MIARQLIALIFFTFSLFGERIAMTGNWNGVREEAKDAGVEILSSYQNDLAGNTYGGKHRGFANAGSYNLSFDLDLEKICNWNGGHFLTSFCVRHGNNLSANKIGNQFPVQQLFGRETYGLTELFLQQEIFEKKVQVKGGRLSGGNDFLTSPLYLLYVNNGICGNPINIFFNTLFTAYPFAQWGAYLHIKPLPSCLLKFGCYNNSKNIFKDKYHGAYFPFKSNQGVTLISEWAYILDGALPGKYTIGGYYVTGRVNKFNGGSTVGNYAYYFLLDQMVYQQDSLQITPWAALCFAMPNNRNRFPFYFDAGIVFKGLFSGREKDTFNIGYIYGAYSSALREEEENRHQAPQNYESVIELNYWYWITPWFVITPDVQYVIQPSGYKSIPNALVLGAQISIDL